MNMPLDLLNESIDNLIKADARIRRLIRWIFVSLFIEFILLILVVVIFTQQINNQKKIADNRQTIMQGCQAGNEFRRDNKQLWDYILALPTERPQTEQEKQRTADFTAFLNKTFAERDCTK